MTIRFHKRFIKRYDKLPSSVRRKVDATISIFHSDPFTARLRNHPLVGSLCGQRAISVTGDVRIIYEMEGDHVMVLLLDVGTHTQVYG